MIKYLEKVLLDKTKDTQSEILLAQWNYDKKIIPAALQSISNLFPHYSLHDETHSITIINNIIRVLGKDNILNLPAIDIWLILEAAYCHDLGMVVSGDKINNSIQSEKFLDFFKELIQDSKNGLHEFAIQFKVEGNQIKYAKNEFNLELNDGIKFILAEYFRRTHADRSKEIILDPSNELSLSSPRCLIPQRIFKLLGNICSSHTKDFKDILKLPFCEVGIDVEDAHPRFIACLLRIGDLLDLDNNRFSEVMLRTLSKVPMETLKHKAKHLSIESFRADRNKIEITAKCDDYDTAAITQHWFNYLNSEISSQMASWNDIVPYKELGYLPTIGDLKVELKNYEFIDSKKKPKFSVDTDKALVLLQGAGIYDEAYQCIREILQNAVDASLIRIWREHKKDALFDSPFNEKFKKISQEFPINIKIEKIGIDKEWQNWKIEIKDHGIGISSEDLKYLMKTGSSSNNKEKNKIIDQMPAWLRPSGTFGIGFQSIFMLTEKVEIYTKSFFTGEFQIIELYSPNSKRNGDILIQKQKTTYEENPGSTIKINFKTKAIPNSYSIKMNGNASIIARNYDPFTNESLDVEIWKIIDEIEAFANKTYIPIYLEIEKTKTKFSPDRNKEFDYFDTDTSLEIKVKTKPFSRSQINTYYKNQKAESRLATRFLIIDVNIHKEKASEVLTLNRNKIKSEYEAKLFKSTIEITTKFVLENFNNIFSTEEEKICGSMFLNYYCDSNLESKIQKFNQWENFKVSLDGKEATFKELLNSIDKLKIKSVNQIEYVPHYYDKFSLSNNELTIVINNGMVYSDYTHFFLFKAKGYFSSIEWPDKFKGLVKNRNAEVIYTKTSQRSPIKAEELVYILDDLKRGFLGTARAIIPCPEEFLNLRIKDSSREPYLSQYELEEYVGLPFPKMLSPFITKEENLNTFNKNLIPSLNDKFYEWVYNNRYDPNVTKEQIIDDYKLLCKNFN